MKKASARKIWDISSTAIIACLVIAGTVITFFYAKGYRLNFTNRTVRQTGVLSVDSKPSRANLYINDKFVDTTPKVVSSIDKGYIDVKVTKENYNSWSKRIPIYPELSSPIFPFLTLKEPPLEKVFSSKEVLSKTYVDPKGNYFILVTKTSTFINLYKYLINKAFWETSNEPLKIASYDIRTTNNVDIQISNNGDYILVRKIFVEDKDELSSFEIINTQSPFQVLNADDLELFNKQYTFTWTNDSKYIILESNNDLFSYSILEGTKYLLIKKQPKTEYIWDTDSRGLFYYLTMTQQDKVYLYTLKQQTLQGNGKLELLKEIYFQKSDEYIIAERNGGTLTYSPITNSPENTRFAGKVDDIRIFAEAKGIFISTEFASYWYKQDDAKYVIINLYPTKYVSLSPDFSKILFKNGNGYGIFTFNKKEMDPVTKLGTKKILLEKEVSDTKWLNDSSNISYIQENSIRIVDIDGDNDNKLIDTSLIYQIDSANRYLHKVIDLKESGFEINRYQIN